MIWRPVAAVSGDDITDQQRFTDDAIAWFEANDIDYLDLFNDDRIAPELFASGDHYNAEGRELITQILADRIGKTG